eukprot:COSAG05_NODE_564_length_8647_cov_65.428872_9_plen_94_part_00
MELSRLVGWRHAFSSYRARAHASQPATHAREFYANVTRILLYLYRCTCTRSSRWWVPAVIPNASARVQMGGGGCQYAGNSGLIQFKGVTRGKK